MRLCDLVFVLLSFFVFRSSHAQMSIGVSTPDASSMLDVQSENRGVLFPRVALLATNVADPVIAPATSLLVYNTATTGDVRPGYYFWNGSRWTSISRFTQATNGLSASGDTVQLGGALTQPTTISALNNINKMLFTGTGVDAFRVGGNTLSIDLSNSRVGIGTTTPNFNVEARGTIAFPEVKDLSIPGPYTSVGINTATGQIGTFTPGAQPIYSRRASNSQRIGPNWINLAVITGASATTAINTVGIIENNGGAFLEFPESGIYRIEVFIVGESRVNNVNSAINTRLLKAAPGSTSFSQVQLLRQFGTFARIATTSTVTFIEQISAGERIRLQVVSPVGGDLDITTGTGGSFSQQLIITKL
jgi:hypothetical protein